MNDFIHVSYFVLSIIHKNYTSQLIHNYWYKSYDFMYQIIFDNTIFF